MPLLEFLVYEPTESKLAFSDLGWLLIGLIAVGLAYAVLNLSAGATCRAMPAKYDYLNTRYTNGQCQFQENDGWVSFTPSS